MTALRKEWMEFLRSSLVYLVVGAIILTSAFVLFQFSSMDVPVSFRTALVPVFQTSLYFLPLLALAYGALSMSLEKTQRTLLIQLARGISVNRFVRNKYLSLYAVFLPVVGISYFIGMIPARMVLGSISVTELGIFLIAVLLLSSVFLALGILLGALVSGTLRLVGGVIGIWLVLIYVYDLVFMYLLPMVSMDHVLLFSIFYFLSPVNAVQYFLLTQLNIYQLSDLSALYEQVTFQSPWLVLILNMVIWIGALFFGTIHALKRKGISHD